LAVRITSVAVPPRSGVLRREAEDKKTSSFVFGL
jgi:hypothetical protein